MTTPTLTITDRVQAGAAWLDENRPGWWQRINLDTLDLAEPCYCVLGQEFDKDAEEADSDFWRLSGYSFAMARWLDDGSRSAGELGFAFRDGDDAGQLTAAWRELILARRAGTETTR